MADIKQVGGRPVIDYMARDYDSLLRAMREQIPLKLPEWTDFTNESDFGNVLLELFAHIGDILSYYQDRVANESFLATARTRRAVQEHLRLIGYELATAAPAATTLAVSVPGAVNQTVTISKGDAFATRSGRDRPSVRFEYARDSPLVIDFAAIAPDAGTGRRVYGLARGGVPVEEGRLITGEVVGTATAAPNQRYPLARPRILLGPPGAVPPTAGDVRVVTRLAGVVTAWTRRESLAFSEAGQRDYVVEVDADDKATVVFGDGRFGVIPDAGATVEASYRVGGGPGGNVLADTVTTIANAAQLSLLGATVTNPVPATGGADREDIAHAVRQAPAVFRSLRRAVTAADYEALALSFKGVGKVRAVATGWNEVTLFVAPEGGGKVSDVLEVGLKAFFEDKRMLTQIVEVSDVDYVPIRVTAQIAVENFFVTADVVAQVQRAAADLLAFDRVTFNQTLYLSRFYEDSQQIPGVVFVNVTEFRRADSTGPPIDPLGKIVLGPNEVPVVPTDLDYAAGMKVEVVPRAGR
jgi:hypothetical protein